MVEIECLACDKTLELPQFIDTDNYDGQLVCSKCKALLHVKLVKGKLRKYKIVEKFVPASESKELVELLKRLRGKAPATRQRHSQE